MLRFKLLYCVILIRRSDGSSLRSRIKCKSRENSCGRSRTRKVNFFIFVVNGLEVLKSLESDDDVVKDHNELLTSTFHCPYLSFKGITLLNFVFFLSIKKNMYVHISSYIHLNIYLIFENDLILDDKPVVVTHGDLLSLADRARVRTHLGELLGVPPMKQIFDISGDPSHTKTLMITFFFVLLALNRNLRYGLYFCLQKAAIQKIN